MFPNTELAAAIRHDRERQAAERRLAASIPRCHRRRVATLLLAFDRALHPRHRQPRPIIICCG